jgi:hypothetical protein
MKLLVGLNVQTGRLRLVIRAIKVVALVAFLSVLALTAPPARSQATTIALPNCLGKPEIKPLTIVFTCADGGFLVERLKWTGWGNTFAAAVGTASVNDCNPNCAGGHYHHYPMVVIANGRQTCLNRQSAYLRVTYAFVGRSPFPADAPGTLTPSQSFPCRPMP